MLSALPSVQAASAPSAAPANSQQVFFVGNNWDGTVTVIRPSGDFGKIGVINMIPDRKERLKEIHLNPIKLIAYTYIQTTAGEGNDQLVDEICTRHQTGSQSLHHAQVSPMWYQLI